MPIALEKPEPRIVNVHEAKTNLSKLLEAVENGQEIIIARNGKPAARLAKFEQRVENNDWSKEMLEILQNPNPNWHLEPDPWENIRPTEGAPRNLFPEFDET